MATNVRAMPLLNTEVGDTMFNKREEATPTAPGSQPMQSQPPRQNFTSPIMPVPRDIPKEQSSGSVAAIGASMIIKGDIVSREELYVDGEVEGKLELQHRLTIGPRGKVRASIKAREVIVQGSLNGNVDVSDKITIQRNGSLIGDIKTAGIIIEDGAYFKGSIDIIKSPPIMKVENVKEETVKAEPVKTEPLKAARASVA
jgi:cytoskeletal protein CcmA (bactofilin family)